MCYHCDLASMGASIHNFVYRLDEHQIEYYSKRKLNICMYRAHTMPQTALDIQHKLQLRCIHTAKSASTLPNTASKAQKMAELQVYVR